MSEPEPRPSAAIVRFAPKPRHGRVLGPRSPVERHLRLAEAALFGALFGLTGLLAVDLPWGLLSPVAGAALCGPVWYAIAPRRGAIDLGTVIVAGLVAAVTGWAGLSVYLGLAKGGGVVVTFIFGFVNALAPAWPAAIAAGAVVARLSRAWRPGPPPGSAP